MAPPPQLGGCGERDVPRDAQLCLRGGVQPLCLWQQESLRVAGGCTEGIAQHRVEVVDVGGGREGALVVLLPAGLFAVEAVGEDSDLELMESEWGE